MVTKQPDAAKRLWKLETVLSGSSGIDDVCTAALVCIGRQWIAIGGGGMRWNTTEAVKRSGKVTNCNGKTAEDDERRREAAEDGERRREAAEVADRRRIGTDYDGSMYCVLDRVFGA